MIDINARIRLTSLRCIDEADGLGGAEPYLWTVFFKVDGTTVAVTRSLRLAGRSVVIGTPGDQDDLPHHDADDGEAVLVPAALGEFRTRLRPIPLQQPIGPLGHIGGVLGVVMVLMQDDNAPASAIAEGDRALNRAVIRSLDATIPTLGFAHHHPTQQEIDALATATRQAVKYAVRDDIRIWNFVGGPGSTNDEVDSAVVLFPQQHLVDAGSSGIRFSRQLRSAGVWEVAGRASGKSATVPADVVLGDST